MPSDLIDPPASEPITELTDREQAILDAPSDVIEPSETDQPTGDDQSADDVSAAQDKSAGEATEDSDLSESQLRDMAREMNLPVEGSEQDLEQAILGKQDQPANPRMDQLTSLAQSYGMDEQDVRQFETPEALERAMNLFEKQFIADGQQQLQEPGQQQQQQQGQQAAQQQPIDPKAFKLEWGEDGVPEDDQYASNMVGLHGETQRLQMEMEHLRNHMVQQQEFVINQQAEQEFKHFDDIVDVMDADLFGGTKEELTGTEVDNRRTLWESAKVLQAGMYSRGREVSLTREFIERAQHHAFADQLQQSERKRLIERVRKQSKRRTGSGSPSMSDVQDGFSGDLVDDPSIKKLFDSFQEDNGAS